MALPMVHLAAAYLWHPQDARLHDSPEYYLGAIAPDAIHARAGTTRADKRLTHFGGVGAGDCVTRIGQLWQHDDSPFAVGYGLHIITDRVWAENYLKFTGLFDPQTHKMRPELYYNDTDQVDFMLYDTLPYREFLWDKLNSATASDFEGLLSGGEIEWWKQRVLHYFDRGESEWKAPIQYLTYDVICKFIGDSAYLCDKKLSDENVGIPAAERVL